MLKIINLATGNVVAAYSKYDFTPHKGASEFTIARFKELQIDEDARWMGVEATARETLRRLMCEIDECNRVNGTKMPGYVLIDTGRADDWALSVSAEVSSS